jgi:microcystin-dependent protein
LISAWADTYLYPVGSIYTNTFSTNPSVILGFGTWIAYSQGRMLIGVDGATYTGGAQGGSATTTLSTTNLPSHTHVLGVSASGSGTGTGTITGTTGGAQQSLSHTHQLGSIDSTAEDAVFQHQDFARSYGDTQGPPWGPANTTTGPPSADMNHTHSISGSCSVSVTGITISGNTNSTGDGTPFSTISPWIAVYMWLRIA